MNRQERIHKYKNDSVFHIIVQHMAGWLYDKRLSEENLRAAIETAIELNEEHQTFDRELWLERNKDAQLTKGSSDNDLPKL